MNANSQRKYINSFPVHPIGIGTWLMGSGLYPDKTHYASYGNEAKEIEAIRYSITQGQNHIDTAMVYGLGHTEEIVGEAIRGTDRSTLFIASKLWKSHLQGDAILKAIEAMLARLQTPYLDLLYLHAYWAEYEPLSNQLEGLALALDRGLIHGIGVSNFSLEQLTEAQHACRYPIVALQNYYSLANKKLTSPELLSYCKEQNIAFITAKPLERGLFLDSTWQKILLPLEEKYKKSAAQIALSWLVSQDNIHAIPKATTPTHIDENVDAASFVLDPADHQLLTSIGQL